MLSDRIKSLRIKSGISQAELARKLNVTRSSINAWESGLSTPTTQYIVKFAKIFHVSSDYILGIENKMSINLDNFDEHEINIIYVLVEYFDSKKKK